MTKSADIQLGDCVVFPLHDSKPYAIVTNVPWTEPQFLYGSRTSVVYMSLHGSLLREWIPILVDSILYTYVDIDVY